MGINDDIEILLEEFPAAQTTIQTGSNGFIDVTESLSDLIEDSIKEVLKTDEVPEYAEFEEEQYTPVNVNTLFEVDLSSSRFSGAMWYNEIQKHEIIIAGQGGIGSWATAILSRVKPKKISIYDFDTIDETNLSGQFFNASQVGHLKVDALADTVHTFSRYSSVVSVPKRWTEESVPGDIMICGFDNMAARKVYFNSWKEHVNKSAHPEKCLFIDGRLDMTNMQVFCITGDNKSAMLKYESKYLFDDRFGESTTCSMKQTTYCASMIGSLITNLFVNFIGTLVDPFSHTLPFKVFYDSQYMIFKIE